MTSGLFYLIGHGVIQMSTNRLHSQDEVVIHQGPMRLLEAWLNADAIKFNMEMTIMRVMLPNAMQITC